MNKNDAFESIIKKTFANKEKSDKLKAVFISGQTGAGKSTYLQTTCDKKTVLIVPDEYLKKIPEEITNEKNKMNFIAEISNKIENMAIENKNNIFMESTIIYPEYYLKEIEKFKKSGYETEFVMVTTNKELSSSRMLNRNEQHYLNFEKNGVPPRIGTLDIHNQLSYLLQNTLREVEESNKFDNIKLVKSNGEEIFNKKTSKGLTAEEVFEKELNRAPNKEEIKEIKILKDKILTSMEKRGDKNLQIIKNFFDLNEKAREVEKTIDPWSRKIESRSNSKGRGLER